MISAKTEDFIQIGPTLINIRRLIVVGPSPRVPEGCYLAIWNTGQELMLSHEHGLALAEFFQSVTVGAEGRSAMISETAQ